MFWQIVITYINSVMNNKKCLGLEEVAFILTIFRFQLQYTLTA